MATQTATPQAPLAVLDENETHTFVTPVKRIHTGQDVSTFLVSHAYRNIMQFLLQLNRAMFPNMVREVEMKNYATQSYQIGSSAVQFSEIILQLRKLLLTLGDIIDEVPLETGPRRFGNLSFRKWYELVENRSVSMLNQFLPQQVRSFKHGSDVDAVTELRGYFLGSFGSAQRLDYGTGHELSFLAFLACIWQLGGFPASQPGQMEREIAFGVIEPYLGLVRRLILTYTLEPAGSHGVWGLDDHSFLPYIFGSAQYGPPITDVGQVPTERSLSGAPDPGIVTKAAQVEKHRKTNMYFGAIGFIYDVKKGPFWEHSPTLYDISGVRAGWAKINKGMIKMYNAEVLSKFPVVQHFPFGSLLSWDRDSNAVEPPLSIHASSQPSRNNAEYVSISLASMRAPMQEGTTAPWGAQRPYQTETTSIAPAPGMSRHLHSAMPSTRGSGSTGVPSMTALPNRLSNTARTEGDTTSTPHKRNDVAETGASQRSMPPPTKAPWAK